jgi:hypothetical protein
VGLAGAAAIGAAIEQINGEITRQKPADDWRSLRDVAPKSRKPDSIGFSGTLPSGLLGTLLGIRAGLALIVSAI